MRTATIVTAVDTPKPSADRGSDSSSNNLTNNIDRSVGPPDEPTDLSHIQNDLSATWHQANQFPMAAMSHFL